MSFENEAVVEDGNPLNGALYVLRTQKARERARPARRSLALVWCGVALVTAAGCLGIHRDLVSLWALWIGDPLRSIGMLIPPVSILLTLRVWKQCEWERRGSWWGLPLIGLAFVVNSLHQQMALVGVMGRFAMNLLPASLSLYFYGAGIIVLFAGWRVWRRAWFPLLLLFLANPIPVLQMGLIDISLQRTAAHVARAFATLIGFAPTTPELRLMFTPDFGMFIAPGCDGSRGAITMAYFALVLGYIKRASLPRWALYVSGALLMGYLFNFMRLCLLVVYYRIALGNPWFEHEAKWADYGIGSCLFMLATLLFLWVARQREGIVTAAAHEPAATTNSASISSLAWRGAAFAILAAFAVSIQAQELKDSLEFSGRSRIAMDGLPMQVGDFKLSRTWFEQSGGIPVVEDAVYYAPGSGEVTLGIWVAPGSPVHNSNDCWLARGLDAETREVKNLPIAQGKSAAFDTGFYSDGNTDSIVATALCTSASCSAYPDSPTEGQLGLRFLWTDTTKSFGSGEHMVSFMVRIDRPHTDAPRSVVHQKMSTEAQKFVSGLDLAQLSKKFQ
jgi:exosortase J